MGFEPMIQLFCMYWDRSIPLDIFPPIEPNMLVSKQTAQVTSAQTYLDTLI